jgi:hypothetical protein
VSICRLQLRQHRKLGIEMVCSRPTRQGTDTVQNKKPLKEKERERERITKEEPPREVNYGSVIYTSMNDCAANSSEVVRPRTGNTSLMVVKVDEQRERAEFNIGGSSDQVAVANH